MKKQFITILGAALLLLVVCFPVPASEESEHSSVDVHDIASLQRGAKWFVNYCLSCHSASYMRYNRLAEDLVLSEEVVLQNLVYADAKIGDTMEIAMAADQAEDWFGRTPPDLTLIGRSRGPDWLYAYLLGFYVDDQGGWNNTQMQDVSMPHVLWRLQGINTAVYRQDTDASGFTRKVIDHFELGTPGAQSPEEFEGTARDLSAFLEYVGEPAILKRKGIGKWVVLFLVLFAFLAYLLKVEYWRDVH